MTPSLLALLRKVDTPTVCNAIEMAQGKRGFDQFTRGTMFCSAPSEGAIVGFARTAKIAAVQPPSEAPEVIRQRRMDYYRYMAEAPTPSAAVVEDVDFPSCIGAYWGEINTSVHKGFGMAGALTNGVMRDLGDMPQGFPVIAGSIGPSHGFVHVREIDTPVSIFGLTVNPSDLIHADRHGAVVVPADLIDQLEHAILKLFETERIILSAASEPGFCYEKFEVAWAAFEKARV
ncbi:RraA family protein [Ruegeria arenilitoris]|uniref:RraA family protein n=1 Tax=Ruegeria arenilitoris TaxID=1173585 RepID=UPI001C96473F|nr:RraA family protein [Ruegeria arenilitoris]MBY6084576.1 RraA family protein [Ruegeria arenilitoris]